MTRRRQRGLTLIELVTSIVIIGIAGSSVLGVLSYLSSISGSGLARARAQDIAELYLAEVLSRPFADPDATPVESSRSLFDDINDFAGLDDSAATDQNGVAIAPWRVRVNITPVALGSVPASHARRVDVQVDLPDGQVVLATGFRTRYP